MSDQDFDPVKLRSPRGNLHTAHTPRELNDLIFGHGYTVVGKRDIADVIPAGTDAPASPPATPKTTPKGADRG